MFGDGYRISMICDKSNISQVRSLMKVLVPGSVFLESSGNSGGLVFTIPMDKINQLGPIFIIMEGGSSKIPDDLKLNESQKKAMGSLQKLVSDVGASQTTLEEVFMAVTSK